MDREVEAGGSAGPEPRLAFPRNGQSAKRSTRETAKPVERTLS
jgi:hypothetical protein